MQVYVLQKIAIPIIDEVLGCIEGQIGSDVNCTYQVVDDTRQLVSLLVHHSFILTHIVKAIDSHLSHLAL